MITGVAGAGLMLRRRVAADPDPLALLAVSVTLIGWAVAAPGKPEMTPVAVFRASPEESPLAAKDVGLLLAAIT
jgi:hypothetical protein